MKRNLLAVMAVVAGVSAQAGLWQESVGSAIPDGSVYGLTSTIQVSDELYKIDELQVNINVSGGYNGDLYAYLSYNGTAAILLNRVGKTATDAFGYADSGFNVTFAMVSGLDSGTDIHGVTANGGVLSDGGNPGLYRVDGRAVSPFSVTDGSAATAMLASFDNLDPNGTWTLFFADAVGGGNASTLNSWSLYFAGTTPVPEPVNVALLVFGGMGATVWGIRRWRARFSA